MRDTLERFARERCSPEAIHREDLTIPEDIIEGPGPGCFGPSVPERFGAYFPMIEKTRWA